MTTPDALWEVEWTLSGAAAEAASSNTTTQGAVMISIEHVALESNGLLLHYP